MTDQKDSDKFVSKTSAAIEVDNSEAKGEPIDFDDDDDDDLADEPVDR